MKKSRGIWIQNKAKYATGELYVIGRIAVASWFIPSSSRGEATIYRVENRLPGFMKNLSNMDFDNPNDARERAEAIVETWFKALKQFSKGYE